MHVAGAGQGLRMARRLGQPFARGAKAELGELLEVGEGKLGEVRELVDRGLVDEGELVGLDHGWGPWEGRWIAVLCCTAQ